MTEDLIAAEPELDHSRKGSGRRANPRTDSEQS